MQSCFIKHCFIVEHMSVHTVIGGCCNRIRIKRFLQLITLFHQNWQAPTNDTVQHIVVILVVLFEQIIIYVNAFKTMSMLHFVFVGKIISQKPEETQGKKRNKSILSKRLHLVVPLVDDAQGICEFVVMVVQAHGYLPIML